MSEEKRPVELPVRDKRRTASVDDADKVADETPGVSAREDGDQILMDETSDVEQKALGKLPEYPHGRETEPEPDYLGDLQRVQAEFENYRKRMMRDQAETAARAKAILIESLLPVIDNFERAIEHGEGGEGVRLVFKELESVLQAAGLEEIAAEGNPFDPHIHEAVESRVDPGVTQPTVGEVHRRGFKVGDRVIRPAMVVVVSPAEQETED